VKLWAALYGMIWLVFLEFLLGLVPGNPTVFVYLHAALGLGVVALAYSNFRAIRTTTAPGRLKRTSRATLWISVAMVLLGGALLAPVGVHWTVPGLGVTVFNVILFFHVVNALAIITQSAAVALGYDLWEDRGYDERSAAGEVPPAPRPTIPAAPRSAAPVPPP
jgi:vacuolar-type H+-ATPase subunit I/STV1